MPVIQPTTPKPLPAGLYIPDPARPDPALLDRVPGLHRTPVGEVVLTGPALTLLEQLDAAVRSLGDRWEAAEHRFPPFLPAAELHRLDWLRSFPQLATFPVTLPDEPAALDAFRAGTPFDGDAVRLPAAAPVRDVCVPAACYPLYVHLQGAELTRATHLSTRATCVRREQTRHPLARGWSFTMREVVCLGTPTEVESFLAAARGQADRLFGALGIPVNWEPASDPFYRPEVSSRALAQRVDPVKHEACLGGLALGSTNRHRDLFGRTWSITRDGRPATSGCVAFGLERLVLAVIAVHGDDPASWPDVAPLDGGAPCTR